MAAPSAGEPAMGHHRPERPPVLPAAEDGTGDSAFRSLHGRIPGAGLLRHSRLMPALAGGLAVLSLGLMLALAMRSAGDRDLARLATLQQQVAMLQAQSLAGSSATSSIQGQLSGLQTQLVVLQAQLADLSQARSAVVAPVQPDPAPRAAAAAVPPAPAPVPDPPRSPRAAPGAAASAEDFARLINEGLRGKDRDASPIYRQIMLSALDLDAAYFVSMAAWGPERSQLVAVLEAARPGDFAFKRIHTGDVVLVVPKTPEMTAALSRAGAREVTAGDVVGYALF